MAISKETDSHDLLHRWQIRMQENVWNFNQAYDESCNKCNGVYLQSEREIIAHALAEAFEIASYELGYYPQPSYVTDKQLSFDSGKHWSRQKLNLGTRYLQAFGTRATTLIEADKALTHSDDEDADAVNDTASLSLTSSITNPDEIQVFYRISDGAPSAAHPQWRIPTKSVTVSSGTASISIHRANLVLPGIWDDPFDEEGKRAYADRANASSDFVTGVDVYRVYTDTSVGVRLLSKPTSSDSNTPIETAAEAVILDSRLSDFYVREGATAPDNTPYAVKVSFQAGLPLVNGLINQQLEQVIIRLANVNAAMINGPMSFRTRNMWESDTYEMENPSPIGNKRAHYESWITILRLADGLLGNARRRSWSA